MSSRSVDSSGHREEGTASVELIAAVPLLLLAFVVAAQIGLVGQALWSAGIAARAGARAALVGGDAGAAARRALPPSLRPGASVAAKGGVSVRVPILHVLPGLPHLTAEAKSGLAP